MKAETSFSLKDHLFNPEKVAYLAGQFVQAYPDFSSEAFQDEVVRAFPDLELKQRIAHISTCLHKYLPAAFPNALEIVLRALPPELDPNKADDDFGDFIIGPLSLFVATYGCSAEHLQISLNGLKEITKRFSAEYAIRFFINAFPQETFAFLEKCAADKNYHVRRLASEGSRPKLPWAMNLVVEYTTPLPILEQLFADSTRYVTRSVANHLNDISKVNPDLVIETLKRWQKSKLQDEKEMAFITTHALRTLVKKGNHDALKLLGFGATPNVTITEFNTSSPEVKIGDALHFVLVFDSNKRQNLMVDYHMQFAGNGSKPGGQKMFKLKQLSLEKGDTISIKKKHPMRLMTTRRLFPGKHEITLQINGKTYDSLSFELVI